MSDFTYLVTVETETAEQAAQVMTERLSHDEDYGFDYEVGFQATDLDAARAVIRATFEAAKGDGNDDEIEALQEARDMLADTLGIDAAAISDEVDAEAEYGELADFSSGIDDDSETVYVSAEHRRVWDAPSHYGPFPTGKAAREWVIEQYRKGDFDPDGCEVTYYQPTVPA